MDYTTVDTVTEERIKQLLREAAVAGDFAMVDVCRTALDTWNYWAEAPREGCATPEAALAECVRVINETEAQS